jgi:hypothetical protein
MADPNDDLNSSDIEFEPAPSKGRSNLGKQSIEDIIAHAAEDRISSKKSIKTLQFGSGSPGNIQNTLRWVKRFNAFRQYALRQNVDLPFTGDDLIRFFDSIIGKLKPSIKAKPVPSADIVRNALISLSSYGTFTYPEASGYKLTARDGVRLQTWVDDAVKSGRLIKGRWKRRVWLNFTIVSRMTKAWLDHYDKYGTRNWDLIIAKHLSIVLVSSLGMRVGDVTRSSSYHGLEYLKYKDVKLRIEGDGEAKLENIRACITLCYTKGKKDILNADEPFYLSPLEDSERHMCIVSLILIHALRHGMVRGSTIQEVLNDTIDAHDSTIVWLYPDRPVTASISQHTMRTMDLENPAHPCQMLRTIKEMGLISNLLSPVTVHSLRYGAAQDTAHLPRVAVAGFTDDTVRQTMGHTHESMTRGVTEMYAGKHTQETYNLRAAAQYVPRWGLKFSETSAIVAVKSPVSDDEIARWQQLNEPDATDHKTRKARERARNAIRAERHREFVATAEPEKKKTGTKEVLSEQPANITNSRSTTRSAPSKESTPPIRPKLTSAHREETSNIDPRLLEEDDLNSTNVDLANLSTQLAQVLVTETPEGHHIDEETSNIDPRLLEEDDLNSIDVDLANLNTLLDQVLITETPEGDDIDEDDCDEASTAMAIQALLGDDDPVGQQQPHNKYDFINHYSRINVVNCTRFADQWAHYQKGVAYADSIGKYSVQGNSRESPTPIRFQCQATPQCPYSSIQKKAVVAHEALCSPVYVARERYRIDHGEDFLCDQCGKSFLTQHLLNMHITSVHNFVPVPCPQGCEPDKIYTSQKTLDAHTRRVHSGIWPARCLYPGCDNETKFKSSSYSNHLTKAHQLTTRAARSPFFPPTMKKVWQPTACPVDDCTESYRYGTKTGLTDHLIKVHGYERKAANSLAACGWVERLSIDVQETSITRKARLKPWEVGKHDGEAENDDNEEEAENEPPSASTKRRKR